MAKKYLTPREVAEMNDMTPERVRQLITDGLIKATKQEIRGGGYWLGITTAEAKKVYRKRKKKSKKD